MQNLHICMHRSTRGAYSPPNGKAMLEHVVTVVLKQPKDGPLAKALDRGGIHEIFGVLSLSQSDCVDLTYVEDGGTVKPISIGHKGKTLKLFAAFCKAEVILLKIRPKSPRKTLMGSGPVMHAFLPLKWMTTSCYLPFPLSLRRKTWMTSGLVMHV